MVRRMMVVTREHRGNSAHEGKYLLGGLGLEQEYPGSWIVMWIVAGREHVQNLLRGGGPTTNFLFCTKVMRRQSRLSLLCRIFKLLGE
jgi:hypothetical protein